jgi:hypothetical protein
MKAQDLDRSQDTASEHDIEPQRREAGRYVARKIARKAGAAEAHHAGVQPDAGAATYSFGDAINAGIHPLVERAAETSGHALPDGLRGRFETSLGVDLGGVRVHDDAAAAHASAALGARAYAVGQDVFVGAGHYAPETTDGAWLLAHEVAHTVQQRGATAGPQTKLEVSEAGDACEVEADAAANAMMEGRAASVTAASGVARKIMPDKGHKPDAKEAPKEIRTVITQMTIAEGGKARIVMNAGSKRGVTLGLHGETVRGGKPTGRKFDIIKVSEDECEALVDGSLDELSDQKAVVIYKRARPTAGPSADDRD